MSSVPEPGPLDRIITIEEHLLPDFLTEYVSGARANLDAAYWTAAEAKLRDLGPERLADMDAHGVRTQVLSPTAPGIQVEPDAAKATLLAARTNDLIAATVSDAPERFAGFATVALQDPAAAVREVCRAVLELGMVGVLVNGHTCGSYLDEPQYREFLETVAGLGVPLYLHPSNSPDACAWSEGHPQLRGPLFGWGVETAAHFLRLLFAGIFDRPETAGLTVILGHAGEGLLAAPSRLDSRWQVANAERHGRHLDRAPSEYLRTNLFVTTSGVTDPLAFWAAVEGVGRSRVGFALDYPMEEMGPQVTALRNRWRVDSLGVAADDELLADVAWRNVGRLLGLSHGVYGSRVQPISG
ncbi:amidohydrolase family protein [Nocardia blacklockiae]|uniref:amidohydrolase family protein n=1 Tax=Nocardia blacklockiae TaxID=480036 RepID=UPI001893F0A5|nr:amidohydrolase family protein [Nocardia blacklockiae]MBF6169849.1 amidohydrolase [Nocardia blacklockiae]